MGFIILMAAVSALAIGNSVFFGSWLIFTKGNNYPNKLLAFLLFALALRISKSVIIIAFPNAPDVFPSIGLIGMAAIGPLIYLYIKSLFSEDFKYLKLLHFIPSLLIAASVAFVDEQIIYRFYQLVVFQIMIYLMLSAFFLKKQNYEHKLEQLKKEWGIYLILGIFTIWIAFFYQLIADSFLSYIIATAIAVIVLYILSFWSMRRTKIFSISMTKVLDSDHLVEVAQKVNQLLKVQKLYKNEDLTIEKIAKMLNIQPYIVSRAVNEVHNQTFPEFINSYRLNEAKQLLSEDINQTLTIESIAYDSGFNTLSTFYSTFKKYVKMTPAEYRKKTNVE